MPTLVIDSHGDVEREEKSGHRLASAKKTDAKSSFVDPVHFAAFLEDNYGLKKSPEEVAAYLSAITSHFFFKHVSSMWITLH